MIAFQNYKLEYILIELARLGFNVKNFIITENLLYFKFIKYDRTITIKISMTKKTHLKYTLTYIIAGNVIKKDKSIKHADLVRFIMEELDRY